MATEAVAETWYVQVTYRDLVKGADGASVNRVACSGPFGSLGEAETALFAVVGGDWDVLAAEVVRRGASSAAPSADIQEHQA